MKRTIITFGGYEIEKAIKIKNEYYEYKQQNK
jgi:hypothetical protein